jgi:Uma2 family endonuclease
MHEVVFESTRTMTQGAFEEWVRARPRGDCNRYELLHRRIVRTPPAGYPHGEIEANLVSVLTPFVKQRGKGKAFGSSQGYALPSGDTVEPDVSFVSGERWNAAPPPAEGAFLRVVPDFVVEILSAGTRSRDRGEKRAIYEANCVREYWLVDRDAREIVAFALDETGHYGPERVFSEGQQALSTVLDGFVVEVREVFP